MLDDAAGALRVHDRSCRTPRSASSRARPASDGDLKRLLLDRPNFYATTGGHGACRGCGEVTAIRLVMATSHALGDERRRAHLRELEALVTASCRTSSTPLDADDAERRARIEPIIATLETRLYLLRGRPDRATARPRP